ncbi:MAG: S41 family peptidase [Bacteroidota bacterium]
MRSAFVLILFLSGLTLKAQVKFNGNMEVLDSKHMPKGWDLTFGGQNTYEVKLDSVEKRQGKYSISLTRGKSKDSYGAIDFPINTRLHGKMLIFVGTIKTKDINNGWAGLWIRIDGQDKHMLGFETMEREGIKGTTAWKEYMLKVPYDEGEAVSIHAGALLKGDGKMWLDSVRLYLDEVPIDKAPLSVTEKYAALNDTAFSKSSEINTIAPTTQNINHLALLGQLWGFLKYHHPAIAKGDYNWDAELFRVMPKVLKCSTDQQLSLVLEKWVDGLAKPVSCADCKPANKVKNIAIMPDYGSLFTNKVFTPSLTTKLKYILDNSNITESYYIEIGGTSGINPVLRHEKSYEEINSPDAGYRLLGLFRYWNVIQYFSPNRNIIPGGWNNKLAEYIPQFINANTKIEYVKTMARLVSATHDTHAFISNTIFGDDRGKFRLPFKADFIGDKLVVNGYYKDTLNVKANFKPGDIITDINGVSVEKLVQQYLPYSSASNKDAALRDMPGAYLLSSKDPMFNIKLIRNGKPVKVLQQAIGLYTFDFYKEDWGGGGISKPGYYLINKQIGYVFPGRFKDSDQEGLKKQFANTKGIIVDLRCYPSADMIKNLGNFIAPGSTQFVKFTHALINHPGMFISSPGGKVGSGSKKYYKGKVVVIVNAKTQSNAEFVTMALQKALNVIVIGGTTAGADGNVSNLSMPWFYTYFTGLGVYYPDGTNAQGKGVKIDYVMYPTIQGVKEGRDELLEKAMQLINQRKINVLPYK